MKSLRVASVVFLCLWIVSRGFAADGSYWKGTDLGRSDWQMPAPKASGPFWGGANGVVAGRMFATRKQLLFAINIWMKQFHQTELTKDDLIVRVATRLNFGEADPRVEELLECLLKDTRLTLPVDLWAEEQDDVLLQKGYSSHRKVSLPSHYVLSIRILNAPWGSKDRNGEALKITSWKIPIAYALK
jgi:hypothetical protein